LIELKNFVAAKLNSYKKNQLKQLLQTHLMNGSLQQMQIVS